MFDSEKALGYEFPLSLFIQIGYRTCKRVCVAFNIRWTFTFNVLLLIYNIKRNFEYNIYSTWKMRQEYFLWNQFVLVWTFAFIILILCPSLMTVPSTLYQCHYLMKVQEKHLKQISSFFNKCFVFKGPLKSNLNS